VNGDVTVSATEPLIEFSVAVMVAGPVAAPVARPPLLIEAKPGADVLHVAEAVTFCVLLSVYVPVAVNCCVPPTGMEAFAGLTAIETTVGAATVSVVEPLTDPEEA